MDGAMIGGPVVTTANPGGSGTGPGWKLEAINTFPRVQRASVSLPELPCERRSSPTELSPGMPKLLEKPEVKTPPSPRLIQDRKPLPDLVSVLQNGSQFRSSRDLGRDQKRFDQDTPAANGHRGETLEPVTGWHLGMGVEPTRQRLEGMGVDAALGDPLEQMPQKAPWGCLCVGPLASRAGVEAFGDLCDQLCGPC